MPYNAPPQWQHLEYPVAAKMNLYKDGLDAIYALLGTSQVNIAVSLIMGTAAHYYFVNRWRWLVYLGAGSQGGRILDPAGVGADVSLSKSGTWANYDLLQVDWLYPGKLYQVQDVTCAFEDYESF